MASLTVFDGNRYAIIGEIGNGALASVYRCTPRRNSDGQKIYALKVIKNAFAVYGAKIRCLRELRILRQLKHPAVLELVDAYQDPTRLYLVTNVMDSDLSKIIHSQSLSLRHVQYIMHQLMAGLSYLYSAHVVHRDLKPENILVDCASSVIRIADFGLARVFDSAFFVDHSQESNEDDMDAQESEEEDSTPGLPRVFTEHVVTRYYRSPEIILRQGYAAAADIWSAGCIFAELLDATVDCGDTTKRTQFLRGNSGDTLSPNKNTNNKPLNLTNNGSNLIITRGNQLWTILTTLGTPLRSDMAWLPEAMVQAIYEAIPETAAINWNRRFPQDEHACELLQHMLKFDPRSRVTAKHTLNNAFFKDFVISNAYLTDFLNTTTNANTSGNTSGGSDTGGVRARPLDSDVENMKELRCNVDNSIREELEFHRNKHNLTIDA